MPDNTAPMSDLDGLLDGLPAVEKTAPPSQSPEETAKIEKLNTKVPGLTLTYGNLQELDLTEEEALKFSELKKLYNGSVHLIRTVRKSYIVRECKQIEWRNKAIEIQTDLEKATQKLISEGRDEATTNKILDMLYQEKIVCWLMVYPQMEPHVLRSELPPGEVSTIFECTMMAQGFGQKIVPIKL